MNIVTNSGAIMGVIIITEHAEFITFPHGYLSDKRHQVIGYIIRIFTYTATRVGAYGIEVAQYGDVPAWI